MRCKYCDTPFKTFEGSSLDKGICCAPCLVKSDYIDHCVTYKYENRNIFASERYEFV